MAYPLCSSFVIQALISPSPPPTHTVCIPTPLLALPPMLHAWKEPDKSVSCCVMPCPHLLPQTWQGALPTAWMTAACGSPELVAFLTLVCPALLFGPIQKWTQDAGVIPPNNTFLDADRMEIRETKSGDNFS